MVDLHTKNSGDRREGKVKILLDRTPSFIRSKFWSVLGSSNDLINGITNKVRINIFLFRWFFSVFGGTLSGTVDDNNTI